MAIWPFSRKRSRKRSPGRGRGQEEDNNAPARSMTESAIDAAVGTGQSERTKSKRQRDSSGNKKLSRRARTYSFSPGRTDSIRVARARQESVPPLPTGPIPVTINRDYGAQGQGPSGAAAKETEIRDRVPTLHHNNSRNKRSGQPLPRKKSSKRRKEDHDREAEIRAMSRSETMPVRPATDDLTYGRPMKRESKRAKTGSIRDWRRPESDLSLPIPESMHSAMSSDSDHISYKVSAFDALAPRPTIRYASNPVFGAPSYSGPLRSSSQKRKLSEKKPISEATLKAHKRVDNLVDDLDASDLRELMERDKRRRERKQEKERERVERRLARRAERQRLEEAEARSKGTPSPQNLERGVMGREAPAVENDTTSAVITSSRRRASIDTSTQEKGTSSQNGSRQRTPSPLDGFHRENSFAIDRVEPPLEQHPALRPEPVSESTTSRSPSPGIIGFMKSRKRRSNSPLSPESEKADDRPDPARTISKSESESVDYRRPSESGSSRAWSSFFRWSRGGRNNRNSAAPSSFSNTSRDSMLVNQSASQPPNHLPIQRSNSKVPKRTMSRFREDLPELPLSPPDSRVASPEVEVQHSEPLPIITDDVVMRYDTPTSGHRATPSSILREEIQPSPAPHSLSMASVDSEGSWFSGKANRKRASSGMRGSITNYPLRSASGDSEERDEHEDATHDDEFLKIVTDEKELRHKSTGEALPSSDEEEIDEQSPKWGNVIVNRTPTFTHHRETMRSREGLLLESFDDDDDEKDSGSSEKGSEGISSFGGESPMVPARATSISFSKGHVRNFSAGSAKLLDISPRVSSDKRRSFGPAAQ